MDDALAADKVEELKDQRTELTLQLSAMELEISKHPVKGIPHVNGNDYAVLMDAHRARVRRLTQIRAELVRLRREIARIEEARYRAKKAKEVADKPQPRQRVFLDDYDLRNALMEPTGLLMRAHQRLNALTRSLGRSEADRGLIDSIHDWLQRHGAIT